MITNNDYKIIENILRKSQTQKLIVNGAKVTISGSTCGNVM